MSVLNVSVDWEATTIFPKNNSQENRNLRERERQRQRWEFSACKHHEARLWDHNHLPIELRPEIAAGKNKMSSEQGVLSASYDYQALCHGIIADRRPIDKTKTAEQRAIERRELWQRLSCGMFDDAQITAQVVWL